MAPVEWRARCAGDPGHRAARLNGAGFTLPEMSFCGALRTRTIPFFRSSAIALIFGPFGAEDVFDGAVALVALIRKRLEAFRRHERKRKRPRPRVGLRIVDGNCVSNHIGRGTSEALDHAHRRAVAQTVAIRAKARLCR